MTARSPRGRSMAHTPFLLMAVCALVAACKDEPTIVVKADGATRIISASGREIVDTAGDGASLKAPTDLPAFAPAYPGARLATQIAGDDGDRGALLVFETSDPVEKVAAFYDMAARTSRARARMIVNEPDTAVRIFGGSDKRGEAAMIAISRDRSISRDSDGPLTEIVITAGLAAADVQQMERKPEAWRERVRMPVRLQ
jgi:hypothetical protein